MVGCNEQLTVSHPAQKHSQNGFALVSHPVGPTKNSLDSPTFKSSSNDVQESADLILPVSLGIPELKERRSLR